MGNGQQIPKIQGKVCKIGIDILLEFVLSSFPRKIQSSQIRLQSLLNQLHDLVGPISDIYRSSALVLFLVELGNILLAEIDPQPCFRLLILTSL